MFKLNILQDRKPAQVDFFPHVRTRVDKTTSFIVTDTFQTLNYTVDSSNTC